MAINYSLMPRTTNPRDKKAPWMVYAAAQSTRTLTTRDIAIHLADHGSPFSVGTIIGLLEDAQKCITEHLADGGRVDLDSLGAFFTTIASRGAASPEEFSTDLIKSVNLRWRPSREMRRRVAAAPLREIPTRAKQRQAKRQSKEELARGLEEDRAAREARAQDEGETT